MPKGLIPEVENPALVITLRDPVKILDEVVSEIRIREPRGLDLIQNGNPVKFNGSRKITKSPSTRSQS